MKSNVPLYPGVINFIKIFTVIKGFLDAATAYGVQVKSILPFGR